MQDTQNAALPAGSKNLKSFWLYTVLGTLAFLVGGFVVWQVYNFNLDEEINSAALIKTRLRDRSAPMAPAPTAKPSVQGAAGK